MPDIMSRTVIYLFIAVAAYPIVSGKSAMIDRVGTTTYQKHLDNGLEIYHALEDYAKDHNGSFPPLGEGASSNEALQILIKGGYIKTKAVFFDPFSPFTPAPPPRNDPAPMHLAPGQNAFAYVSNLTINDRSLPLLVTAFKEGTVGTYNDDPIKRPWPSVWRENPSRFDFLKASVECYCLQIVVDVDGSARMVRPKQAPDGSYRIYGHTTDKEKEADIFEPAEGWLKENQRPVNPASPPKESAETKPRGWFTWFTR